MNENQNEKMKNGAPRKPAEESAAPRKEAAGKKTSAGGSRKQAVEHKRRLTQERIEQQRLARQRSLRIRLIAGGGVAALLVLLVLVLIFKSGKGEETPTASSATATTEVPVTAASTVQPSKTTEAPKPVNTWVAENGATYYYGADSQPVKLQIIQDRGKEYFLGEDGRLVTDRLVSQGGSLYTADSNGVLTKATGWHEEDGRNYYADENGKVYISQYVTIDGDDYFMDQYGAVVKGTPTIDQYLGSAHLLNWMETHFNDYYFKTPYDGIWTHLEDPEALLRPYGEYGESGGMNCSGFVSHMIQSTGGDLEKVNAMGMDGGFIDADSYLYLGLREYVQCKTYDSVEELLASGDAKKGDILYLYPDKSENEDADCHLGIFWGDTPSENKFWSQAQDTGCGVTEIRMLNPIKKIYLLSIDGR